MFILRFIWGLLTSRRLWVFFGVVLLCVLIWLFGPALKFGESAPLADELMRLVAILVVVLIWLIRMFLAQRRAIKANQVFVSELARPDPIKSLAPGEENLAAVSSKFANILSELKRRKLGGKKFLRDMPWYVFIGPPGTGKTTALKQSGLNFPIDLSDDVKGVGGTRNCDWFFTEEAVLVDTAGRYVQQESQPDVDAAEWLGFLDLLKKHRGKRALNGVIVTLSCKILAQGDAALRAHAREIRKRLTELSERLELRIPVYLMLTKADLLKGFEAFFGGLTTAEREQVLGATFPTEGHIDGVAVGRELSALTARLETRLIGKLEGEETLANRAEIFRFPAQLESLSSSLKMLIETIFGESRYEESAWLRGFYFTSATQEGTPIDRLVGSLSAAFGIDVPIATPSRRTERRSFFLKDLLTEVIFKEAGLGIIDAKAEARRKWVWRGALASAVGVAAIGALTFTMSYFTYRAGITAQADALESLQSGLANVAARQAPLDPLDLDVALDAVGQVVTAESDVPLGIMSITGPSAASEIDAAQRFAYEKVLRNVLEPRMVAVLEATMWQHIRDPEFVLGALKVYLMVTGHAIFDADFAKEWWQNVLPTFAPTNPFPTESAIANQLAAFDRLANEEHKIAPDSELLSEAVQTICSIPLSVRAYRALMTDPSATALAPWIPAEFAGPNGSKVLVRASGKTLRVGIDGVFTYAGFHNVVLNLVPEIAAQAELDRTLFAGGCSESADASSGALENDMLKLYYEDFIAQWDGFLRDVSLAPMPDLRTATENLKDLSSADSAMKRLLVAIVAETELTRVEVEAEGGPPPGLVKKVLGKLGKLGKLAQKSQKLVSTASAPADPAFLPGQQVADHFKPLKGAIAEVDGQPPALDDAVLALSTLNTELQKALSSPDPEGYILGLGGLAELIGAIANQASILPDPLDDWVAGIARDTKFFTQDAIIAELAAILRTDISNDCRGYLGSRFPFDPSSSAHANPPDIAKVLGPGQLIDKFVTEKLAPYIDTTQSPWQWRADIKRDPAALVPFERARKLRDVLFPGGQGPLLEFDLKGIALSANAVKVTLDIDGQELVFTGSETKPVAMKWPGTGGSNVISLTFTPADNSIDKRITRDGSWALLTLIQDGDFSPTSQPDLFQLRLAPGGFSVTLELQAHSVDNAFNLSLFSGFRCPEKL